MTRVLRPVTASAMRRSTVLCLALLIGTVTATASAAVDWQKDVNAALQRARTERKLLIIEIRSARCSSCNSRLEEMAYPVWEHPAMAELLTHFVMVRVTEPDRTELAAGAGSLVGTILSQTKSPSVTLADAAGQAIRVVKPGSIDVQYETFTSMLIADPNIRQLAIAGAEQRLAGKKGDPDNAIGLVLLQIGDPRRAVDFFQTAAREYRGVGENAAAQRADLNAAVSWYHSGRRAGVRDEQRRTATARAIVANVIAHAADQEVRAEALYTEGVLYLGETKTSGTPAPPPVSSRPRTGPGSTPAPPPPSLGPIIVHTGDKRRAIEAFRKAYALAAPGSEVLAAARTQLEALDDQPLPRRGEGGNVASIRLLVPARRPLLGMIDVSVEAEVVVHHVDYYVDDLRVGTSDRKPFHARVDLGAVPTLRMIKARASDANGNVIGEAMETVNDRADAAHVAIISPVNDAGPGLVPVEASVDLPPARRLQSVDFFFNDVKFGSAKTSPFRQMLAANGRFGYIRVVALLDDGSTAEDARVINAGGVSESMVVQGVTFIATVLDDKGRRLDDLKSSDFEVTEDGGRVGISAVNGDPDDPVTVAFAIDSSDSMASSLLFARELASRFAVSSLRPNDRMLVVKFDTLPRLAHPASADADSIQRALDEVHAAGGTSIFDGVLFALLQIQRVPGKKALVVISDGGEGHSSANAKTCVRSAKALGIPIYGISPPMGQRLFHPLEDLALLTGGLFVYAPARTAFPALAARIRDEIRGQYLITFVSKLPPKAGAWRTLKVTVPTYPNAVVRTISGYYVQ